MRSGHVHAVVVGSASGVALRGAPSSQLCTSGRFPEIQRQVPVNMDALWLTLERCTVSHRHAPHEAKITWVHIGTQSVSRHVSSMSADRQLHSVRTQRQRAAVRYGPESRGPRAGRRRGHSGGPWPLDVGMPAPGRLDPSARPSRGVACLQSRPSASGQSRKPLLMRPIS